MVTVNLLPDSILQLRRQQHIKRRGTLWVAIIAGVLAAIAVVMFAVMIFSMRQRDEARDVNNQVWQEVSSQEEQQKRDQVLATKTSVDALATMLGKQRQFTVFLNDMEENLPTNVWVRSLSLSNDSEFQIEGRTRGGYDGIATYLSRLRSESSLFSNVTLFSANNVNIDEFGFNMNGTYQGGTPPALENTEEDIENGEESGGQENTTEETQ